MAGDHIIFCRMSDCSTTLISSSSPDGTHATGCTVGAGVGAIAGDAVGAGDGDAATVATVGAGVVATLPSARLSIDLSLSNPADTVSVMVSSLFFLKFIFD